MRVALVVMPFAAADRPSLAVGLLQAGLERAGIECRSRHLHLDFWRQLGPETYRLLSEGSTLSGLGGEWAFSQVFYGQRFSDWEGYEREVLDHPLWGLDREDCREAIRAAAEAAPAFLDAAFAADDWGRYDLVGFTSTFEQTLPALCLAKRIRERHPEVLIAVGGANFEAEMGRPYIERFDFVDFVSTGEADDSFPALCRSLRQVRAGETECLEVPPGFLYRAGSEVRETPRNGDFVRLDALPAPDYDDFFRAASEVTRGRPEDEPGPGRPWLPIEASRGCWWGHKAHCTFCGLNGQTMAFRHKDWRRVVEETDELRRRHGAAPLQFADNILAMNYFEDLLPHWAEHGGEPHKFFEIKANLRRGQVRLLKESGIIWVQPGIESLVDRPLGLMQKGVSAAQNVALLRWCAELGVEANWNVLFGFPQEDLGDYDRNLEALRRLTHLPAPTACTLIRMDRFSPNFTRFRAHGFEAIEPLPVYRHLFPFDDETLRGLAYYFQYRHPQLDAAHEVGWKLVELGMEWKEKSDRGENGELAVKPHFQGGYIAVDYRYNFERSALRLGEVDLAWLLACDAPTSRRRALRRVLGAVDAGRGEAEKSLDRLIGRSFISQLGNRLVTLALLPQEIAGAPLERAD